MYSAVSSRLVTYKIIYYYYYYRVITWKIHWIIHRDVAVSLVFRPSLGAELIPLELKLSVFVKVFFFLRFDKVIWHYPGHLIDLVKGTVTTLQPDKTQPHFSFDFSPVPALHVNPAWARAAERVRGKMQTARSHMHEGFNNLLRGLWVVFVLCLYSPGNVCVYIYIFF